MFKIFLSRLIKNCYVCRYENRSDPVRRILNTAQLVFNVFLFLSPFFFAFMFNGIILNEKFAS